MDRGRRRRARPRRAPAPSSPTTSPGGVDRRQRTTRSRRQRRNDAAPEPALGPRLAAQQLADRAAGADADRSRAPTALAGRVAGRAPPRRRRAGPADRRAGGRRPQRRRPAAHWRPASGWPRSRSASQLAYAVGGVQPERAAAGQEQRLHPGRMAGGREQVALARPRAAPADLGRRHAARGREHDRAARAALQVRVVGGTKAGRQGVGVAHGPAEPRRQGARAGGGRCGRQIPPSRC